MEVNDIVTQVKDIHGDKFTEDVGPLCPGRPLQEPSRATTFTSTWGIPPKRDRKESLM